MNINLKNLNIDLYTQILQNKKKLETKDRDTIIIPEFVDKIIYVHYGLSNLTVNKHSAVNYESGVYATDDKDGSVSFTVNSSAVNTAAAGTYYATYSAVDAAGNTSGNFSNSEMSA